MSFRFPVVALALVAFACDERSPVAPEAQPMPGTSAPSARTITGVVRDERGVPIQGATVWTHARWAPVLSDAEGRFTAPVTDGAGAWVWIFARKAGYEDDSQEINVSARDLTLPDIVTMPVGGSARVTVGPNAPWIYVFTGGSELNYRIRVVRVTAAKASTVDLRLVADDGVATDFWVRRGCCVVAPGVMNMAAGSELEVEIRVPAGPFEAVSRTFTFTAAASQR